MYSVNTDPAEFTTFSMQDYLDTPERINEYVQQVCHDGDAGELARCLRHVASAKGTAIPTLPDINGSLIEKPILSPFINAFNALELPISLLDKYTKPAAPQIPIQRPNAQTAEHSAHALA